MLVVEQPLAWLWRHIHVRCPVILPWRTWLRIMLFCICGAGIALFSWPPGPSLLGLILFPYFWACAGNRLSAGILAFAYYLTYAAEVPSATVAFFGHASLFGGILLWLTHAVILALPWALLYPRNPSRIRLSAHFFAALLIVSIPPIGVIGWASPITVAGALLPNTGWFGLAATLIVMMMLAAVVRCEKSVQVLLFVLVINMSIFFNVLHVPPPTPRGWLAIETRYGPPPDQFYNYYQRQKSLIATARDAIQSGNNVVIFPEQITGRWTSAADLWWSDLAEEAAMRDVTVLIGAGIPTRNGYLNALLPIGADADRIPLRRARQPMPVGSWRPWSVDSDAADWRAPSVLTLRGHSVGLSFCYEDMLVWPVLQTFLSSPRPKVLISISNHWWADGLNEPALQARAIYAWARLFGVPLLRADNLP